MGVSAPLDPSPDLLLGADTCREDVTESSCDGKGKKLELICLDSGGGGGSSVEDGISRLVAEVGDPEGGGKVFPPVVCCRTGRADEADPVDGDRTDFSGLKLVGGGSLLTAVPNAGPNTFSKDRSFCWVTGDAAPKGDAGISDELPWRRKNGLLALIVEGAGLAT